MGWPLADRLMTCMASNIPELKGWCCQGTQSGAKQGRALLETYRHVRLWQARELRVRKEVKGAAPGDEHYTSVVDNAVYTRSAQPA